MQANKKIEEAEKLEELKKYIEAIKIYEEILKSYNENIIQKDQLKEKILKIKNILKEMEEKEMMEEKKRVF